MLTYGDYDVAACSRSSSCSSRWASSSRPTNSRASPIRCTSSLAQRISQLGLAARRIAAAQFDAGGRGDGLPLAAAAAMGGEVPPAIAAAANHPERLIRPADRTTVGTAILFEDESAELSDQNQADLRRVAHLLSGKPQTIEVRGHTSPQPTPLRRARDPWELAYRRARATMQFLVDDLNDRRIAHSRSGPWPVPCEPIQRLGSQPAGRSVSAG